MEKDKKERMIFNMKASGRIRSPIFHGLEVGKLMVTADAGQKKVTLWMNPSDPVNFKQTAQASLKLSGPAAMYIARMLQEGAEFVSQAKVPSPLDWEAED
jgi:hypothetical protein